MQLLRRPKSHRPSRFCAAQHIYNHRCKRPFDGKPVIALRVEFDARIGDRRQGGAGTRVQSFVEQGFPTLRDEECFADLDEMLALAQRPNVAIKASSLPCYTNDPYPFAKLTPYLKRTFEAFGADRMMWGSDVTRLPCSYRECLDHFAKELPFLSDDDRTRVLGGTAAKLLRWPANGRA